MSVCGLDFDNTVMSSCPADHWTLSPAVSELIAGEDSIQP